MPALSWPHGNRPGNCKAKTVEMVLAFVKASSQPPSVEPFGQKASALLKSISDSVFKGFSRQNGDKRLQAFPILPAECRREPKRFVRCRPPSKADAHGALQEIRRTACQTLRAKGRMRLSAMDSVHRAKRPGAAKSVFSVQQNNGLAKETSILRKPAACLRHEASRCKARFEQNGGAGA